MKTLATVSLFLYLTVATSTTLPELHTIKTAFFKYPYGCRPRSVGFDGCALFLTDYGLSRNMPDLLYNGACDSDNWFDVMLAGNDFGMLSDLGDVPLHNVSAARAFNYEGVVGKDNKFFSSIKVVKGHTYAVLLAKGEIRALFVFRVESYVKRGPAMIKYAVKQYGIVKQVQEAQQFDWSKPNH